MAHEGQKGVDFLQLALDQFHLRKCHGPVVWAAPGFAVVYSDP